MSASQPGPRYTGWFRQPSPASGGGGQGTTESLYVTGTKVLDQTNALTSFPQAVTVSSGNHTVSAGDERVTAGNVRLGVVSAFGTTEPTSAVVMKQGTAFAGAITTSGGIMSNGTVVRKIIADGTVSNVET